MVRADVTPEGFGRIAAMTAKQVIQQRIREAERAMMYDEYIDRQGEVVTGIVQQAGDRNNVLVDLGRVEALLPRSEQVDGERYEQGSRIKAVITEVRSGTKGPQVILSRRDPELIKTLFELEVPEIADGLVEIRGVAREPGYRSKIAVESHTQGVDPVGACVGPRGSRVRMVVSELRGEKIDIIPWNTEPARFVAKALSPARVREVYIDDDTREATVVVPDDQLALAIGKDGLNARLAARLTGWKVDIQSDTEFAQAEAEAAYAGEDDTQEFSGAARRCSRTASAARTLRCPARTTAACRPTRRCTAPSRLAMRARPTMTRTTPRSLPRSPRRRGCSTGSSRRPSPPERSRSRRPPSSRTRSRRQRSSSPRSGGRARDRRSWRSRRTSLLARDRLAGENVCGLWSQGAAGGARALRLGRRRLHDRPHDSRPGRVHLPAARLLRAGGRVARLQPGAAPHRPRRAGSRAPLHWTGAADGGRTQQAQPPDPPPRRPLRTQAPRRHRRRQLARPRRPPGARPRRDGRASSRGSSPSRRRPGRSRSRPVSASRISRPRSGSRSPRSSRS